MFSRSVMWQERKTSLSTSGMAVTADCKEKSFNNFWRTCQTVNRRKTFDLLLRFPCTCKDTVTYTINLLWVAMCSKLMEKTWVPQEHSGHLCCDYKYLKQNWPLRAFVTIYQYMIAKDWTKLRDRFNMSLRLRKEKLDSWILCLKTKCTCMHDYNW